MSRLFENSASGPLANDTIVECGVCWWTYDPRVGALEHDLLPGIGFSDLPAHFRCPECDAAKDKFMLKPGANDPATEMPDMATPAVSMEERLEALKAAYLVAENAMIGLPVHNAKLKVELVGFRDVAEGYVGVVITPWSMNIALLPKDPGAQPTGAIGATRDVAFPSGVYGFLAARLDDFGALETCNLISPMEDFDDQDIARLTAESALEGLFEKPEPAPEPVLTGQKTDIAQTPSAPPKDSSTPADPSRRAFFGRRGVSAHKQAEIQDA